MTGLAAGLAVAAAGLAVLLALPPRPALPPVARAPAPARVAVLLGAAALLAVMVVAPRLAVLAAVTAGALAGAAGLWRGRRRARDQEVTAQRVLEACDLLAADLEAGQPPGAALDAAARVWPVLDEVAEAFALGADVPGALRRLASRPGAGDLRLVAASWQVAHHAGAGLADAVARTAEGLRRDQSTRRVVAGELASARSTARLMAGLPALALLMGSGAGGDPWGFLLFHPVGLACLGGGLALGLLGLGWIERIARSVAR